MISEQVERNFGRTQILFIFTNKVPIKYLYTLRPKKQIVQQQKTTINRKHAASHCSVIIFAICFENISTIQVLLCCYT